MLFDKLVVAITESWEEVKFAITQNKIPILFLK